VALVAGVALVGALVALQLVDDGDSGSADGTGVRVRGAVAHRALLEGTVAGADGWSVEVTILDVDQHSTRVAARDGRYRARDLSAGPVEVSWVGTQTASGGEGIDLGGQRTGRVEIVLEPGRNTYDITL
jgi:hypothetical protein